MTWTHLRRQARGFAATQRVAKRLRNRLVGAPADWAAIGNSRGVILFPNPDWSMQRRQLAEGVLTGLMIDCGLRPSVEWDAGNGRPVMEWEAQGLVGVLALLAYRAVSRIEAKLVCDACGIEVFPIKPRPGMANYCADPECKREGARRRSHQSRAARKATS